METVTVGLEEFQKKLASYVVRGGPTVAVTRDGETVGYFIPVRRQPTEEDIRAFRESSERLQQEIAEIGLTEDEIVEEFQAARRARRQQA